MKKLLIALLALTSTYCATIDPAGVMYDRTTANVLPHGLNIRGVGEITGDFIQVNTNIITPEGAESTIPMEKRLNYEINALDSGVTESSPDISTNLQKAQARAEGKRVIYLPPGTYTLSGLKITNNFTLRGDPNGGTIIKHKIDSTTSMFYTDINDTTRFTVHFENITLDGQQALRVADDSTRGNMDWRLGSIIYTANQYHTLDCYRVTFKNHLRAAIDHYGTLKVDQCQFWGGAQHNMIQTPYAGFSTYINGYAGIPSSTVDTNDLTIEVTHSYFHADSLAFEDLGKNPGGIIFSEQEVVGKPGNVFNKCTFIGNKFLGVSVTENANHIGAINSYNGSRSIIAEGNHIYYFSLSGLAIGRSDEAVVIGNILAFGNEYSEGGTTPAISWSPIVREGSYPFTSANGRDGEKHYSFICVGNTITNVQSVGIQINGDNAIVANNIISDVRPSHGIYTETTKSVGAGVLIGVGGTGNHIKVVNNLFRNIPYNCVYFAPVSTETIGDIDIIGNTFMFDTSMASSNYVTAGQLVRLNGGSGRLNGGRVSGNKVYDIKTGTDSYVNANNAFSINNCDNITLDHNYAENSLNAYSFFGNNTNITFAYNSSSNSSTGLVISGATADFRATFNQLQAITPTSVSGSATRVRTFMNSWDRSQYDQNLVTIRPETDSTNIFNIKNGAGGSILLGANGVNNYIFGLNSSMNIYRAVNDGAPSTPSFGWFYDSDTGFYRSGSGQIAYTGDGVNSLIFNPTGIGVANGSSTSPSIFWKSDNDSTGTGFYRSGANEIGFANNGVQSGRIDASGIWYLNNLTANTLVYANGSKGLTSVTIGAGLDFTGGVLSSTADASGEANSGVNLGTGVPTYENKTGVTLNFNTFTNGNGISLTSNANTFTYSANLQEGANIDLTTNVDKSITIAVNPTGLFNGTEGTVVNPDLAAQAYYPAIFSDATGTNIISSIFGHAYDTDPSVAANGLNFKFSGDIIANQAGFAGITNSGNTANTLIYADANKKYQSVTLGDGLDLTSGTLSVTCCGDCPPISFWKFDEETGDAIDYSGNGNDLTEHGTVANSSTAKIGTARSFNSSDLTDYFSAPTQPWNTLGSQDFTIAFWFNLAGVVGFNAPDMAFMGKWEFGDDRSWMVELDKGTYAYDYALAFYYSTDGVDQPELVHYEIPYDVRTGWNFVVVRREGTSFRVSITPDAATSVAAGNTTAFGGSFRDNPAVPFTIGAILNTGSPESLFDTDGIMDEVGMWKCALSEDQLNNMFNSGAGKSLGVSSKLAGNWKANGADSKLTGSATITGSISASTLVNSVHDHLTSASGGTLDAAAIASGTISTARLGSGTASSSTVLYGDNTWGAIPGGGSSDNWTALGTTNSTLNGISYQHKVVATNGVETAAVTVNDDPYDATSWLGSTNVPTKNAIRNKLESLVLSATPWVSITDYGAVGDGTTDNTVAISNAVNAAASQNISLFIPAGLFVTKAIHITNDVTSVFGLGTNSCLVYKSGETGTCITTHGPVTLNNFTIYGGDTQVFNTASPTIGTRVGLVHDPIGISEVSKLNVYGFDAAGIRIGGTATLERTNHAVYVGNWIHDSYIGYTNITGAGEYTKIANNIFWNCWLGFAANAANLEVDENVVVDSYNGAWWGGSGGGRGHQRWNNNTFNHLSGTYSVFISTNQQGGVLAGSRIYSGRGIFVDNSYGIDIYGTVGDSSGILQVDAVGKNLSKAIRYHDNLAGGTIDYTSGQLMHWSNYKMTDGTLQDGSGAPYYASGGYGEQNDGSFLKRGVLKVYGSATILNSAGTSVGTLNYGVKTSTKTANYTVLATESATSFNNSGAAGTVNFTLPAAVAGMTYEFIIVSSQTLTVTANGTETIRNAGSVSVAGGNITANTVGNVVKVVCPVNGVWYVNQIQGTWTLN